MRSRLLALIAHFLTSKVRDCSLEEEIGCEESTGEDGGVSTEYSREKYSRENATIKTSSSHRQSWLASVRRSFATRTGSLQDRRQQTKVTCNMSLNGILLKLCNSCWTSDIDELINHKCHLSRHK